MFAHRSFLDAGIRVPGASDYGPGPFEPLMAIQSMVTRRDYRGQRVGPEPEGDGRRGAHDRDDQRRVRVVRGEGQGIDHRRQVADFVMLEKDPHDVDPDDDQGHQGRADGRRREDGARRRVAARAHRPQLRPREWSSGGAHLSRPSRNCRASG